MKKICFLMLSLASGLALFAQNSQPIGSGTTQPTLRTPMEVKPRFGVKGGVNLASLEIDDDVTATNFNANRKTSFHVGAFVNIPIGGMFRIQPELLYIGQGSKVSGTPVVGSQTSTDNYELDLDYIALPVMFQLQTPGRFFVELGPQFAFLTTGRQDNQMGADPDIKDLGLARKTDFALLGGIGYTTRVGVGVHATYIHGLSNVFNSDHGTATQRELQLMNRGVKIGLHWQIGAHK